MTMSTHTKTVICLSALCVAMNGQLTDAQAATEAGIIRDANGNELADGDTVVVVKDLKVKGAGVLETRYAC